MAQHGAHRFTHWLKAARLRGRLWPVVVVPLLTALALALSPRFGAALAGPPGRQAPDPLQRAGLCDRGQLETALSRDSPRHGGGALHGAALVVRLDGADALRARHGEAALQALGAELSLRLGRVLREHDLYCALAPDGFAVALQPQPGLDRAGVLGVAQRIQNSLSQSVRVKGRLLRPSVSIGLAVNPQSTRMRGPALLEAAQKAARRALEAGPGGLVCHAAAGIPATIDGERVAALRRALENGEIRAHFQPQIRSANGQISGLEALARWYHPQDGVLLPADFLPQIEAAGLSHRLAGRMLNEAMTTLAALDGAGLPVPSVAVNLSEDDLRNPRLVDEIACELERCGLAPERLTLEILETVVADSDEDAAVTTVARLVQMGCRIDLDDFGTGHASITSIRRFALARLKIDHSFITRLHENPEQQRIVAAILSMAHELDLATVAEGVESREEQCLLARLGCDHLQGYAIARPMPSEALSGWLRAHQQALARGEPWCDAPLRRVAGGGT